MKGNISDRLANERTLLAWVRTGIGIMAFGFVVVKFSLFVRQISLALGQRTAITHAGYSAPIGISLVGIGALSLLLSLLRYHKTSRRIDAGDDKERFPVMLYLIVGAVIVAAMLLLMYLFKTT